MVVVVVVVWWVIGDDDDDDERLLLRWCGGRLWVLAGANRSHMHQLNVKGL